MGKYGKHGALVGLIAGLCGAPAHAACRLALALALDVSSSVDAREYILQRDGLAAALVSEEVQAELFSGAGDVAISAYEWSGLHHQFMILDWTLLSSPAKVLEAAGIIHAAERQRDDLPTAIGAAVGYSGRLFRNAPDCDRYTLDISGDGVHNHGYSAKLAYKEFPLDHVTVNGLVILGDKPEVAPYYLSEVIKGPGAFVEVVADFEGYQRAMERKLIREIGSVVIGQAAQKRRR